MICINDPTGLPSRPDSVVLCELVVAAGLAGRGLTLCFDHFPAVVLSEIYRYCIRGVTASSVLRIRSQRDLRNLEQRMETIRVVLVESERLLPETQWLVHMESASCVPGEGLPAVLCSSAPGDPENLPEATLVLQGSESEFAALSRWRRQANALNPHSVEVRMPRSIELDPNVLRVVERFERATSSKAAQQISAERILVGLMIGVSVLRTAGDTTSDLADIAVTSDDYRFVRARLQRPLSCSADVECDPLAVDMVQRTNVYLGIRFGRDTSPDDSIWARKGEYMQLDRSSGRKPPVTRREIADLGNTKSGLIRRLVTSLQRMQDGCSQFAKLGLVRRLPSERDWLCASSADLAKCLKPWSVKQVRTNFDTLQRRGLVTAVREHNNGPWQYELPEALTTNGSPFGGLPPLED
jgi:hypothetical protein